MTDKIWKDVIDSFDAISEQIRALDIFAPASLSSFQKFSVIEDLNDIGEGRAMLYELLLDNDKVVEALRVAENMSQDHPGLQNFLQGRIEQHEKWGWFLRATVKK